MNATAKMKANRTNTGAGHHRRERAGNGVDVTTLTAANDATLHADAKPNAARNIAMLMAAPFIGLAYVIALPAIGLYQFARLAMQALGKHHPGAAKTVKKGMATLRNIGLFFAAPFIALAYVIALPAVGLYTIAKVAKEAHAKGV